MLTVGQETPDAAPSRRDEVDDPPPPRTRRLLATWAGPSTVAVVCWGIGSALAVAVVHAVDPNPLTVAGAVLPIAFGAVAVAVVLPVAVRWPSDRMAGGVAGLYAAWIALVQVSGLHGTPFAQEIPYSGDTDRLISLAERLSTTWRSADAFLPGVPSEYPPLYPWIVGHLADLLNRPAWTMMKPVQIVVISGTVIAAFVLWRRLVGAPIALAMAAVAPAIFTWAFKDYEIITLAVFIPYVLATFTGRPRSEGGLHWLPAGIIGGLFVTTYVGYLFYGSAGVLALIVVRLLRPDRRRYLLHLLGVAITAAVVASWYLLPLAIAYLTRPREPLALTFPNRVIASDPVPTPFFEPTVFGALALAGLAGMFWYRRREWWAQSCLLLLCGIALSWGFAMLSLVLTGTAYFVPKVPRMVSMLLVVSGVLTVARAAGPLARKLAPAAPRSMARSASIGALTLLLIASGLTCWEAWTPGSPRGFESFTTRADSIEPNGATKAHLETLPNRSSTRFAPDNRSQYPSASSAVPVNLIRSAVQSRLGPDARPMSLSVDSRIYKYVDWYCYLEGRGYASNSLALYTSRHQELRRLSAIAEPTAFATASAHTRFGPIDVFVLRKSAGKWVFRSSIQFSPDAFKGGAFDVVNDVPGGLVVAVRRR